jgi:hypothetical protein
MHPQGNTTDRFFADCEGPDDPALSAAFQWLVHEVEQRQASGLIVTYAKGNAENLERVLGRDETKALLFGRSLRVKSQTVSLATMTKRLPNLRGAVVLAVWLDDGQLARIDDGRPLAICAIPWLAADIQTWRASWNPVEIRAGEPTSVGPTVGNPVVIEALRSLTLSANLSTGLSHPRDRDEAVHTFRALAKGGEAFDPTAVRAWAVQNGWSARGADELQQVAQDVRDGKRLRTHEGPPPRSGMLDYWRQQAVSRK